jgi:hypothetical protein
MPGHVLYEGEWVPYYEQTVLPTDGAKITLAMLDSKADLKALIDDSMREEAFGERPEVDPFLNEEPVECGADIAAVCDACN